MCQRLARQVLGRGMLGRIEDASWGAGRHVQPAGVRSSGEWPGSQKDPPEWWPPLGQGQYF